MIYFRSGYLYQTSRPYLLKTGIVPPEPIAMEFFSLYSDGTLNIKAGYAYDGASWCPEVVVPPECSGPHDAFCQMMRHGLLDYDTYAPLVHGLLRDMVEARRGKLVAWVVWKAVTLARGGHPSNNDDNPEKHDP